MVTSIKRIIKSKCRSRIRTNLKCLCASLHNFTHVGLLGPLFFISMRSTILASKYAKLY
uniref:Uncharacterized protein n=1 Tax=Physcomitrium patens TaxID=3218 RepID=A0A2K1I9Q7_PHYPA|nr:hypothetical protein PHYPA_031222 [Physcomitrium patens]